MDELELLATARPVAPPSRAVTADARNRLLALAANEAAQAAAAERLVTPDPEPAPPVRPRRRLNRLRWGLIPAAAVGALSLVAAVALTIGNGAPGGGNTLPGRAEPEAREMLVAAAVQALRDPAADRGRHWVSKVQSGTLMEVGAADNRYAVLGRTSVTTWFSLSARDRSVHLNQWAGAAPATPADRAAWQRAGEPSFWVMDPGPGCQPDPSRRHTAGPGPVVGTRSKPGASVFRVAGQDLTEEDLRELPADGPALKEWLIEIIRAEDLPAATDIELARSVFDAVVNLLFQAPVTPQVRAAAYGVLADLPGVRSLGTVTDPLGRTGSAVTITSNDTVEEQRADTGGPMEDRIVVDPTSGQPLSYETRALAPADYLAWVPAGALFQFEAVVDLRWTDDQPPAAPDAPDSGFTEVPCKK